MQVLIRTVQKLLFNKLINRRYTTTNGPSNLLMKKLAGIQGKVDMSVRMYVCMYLYLNKGVTGENDTKGVT
jgi:hypothetical protein